MRPEVFDSVREGSGASGGSLGPRMILDKKVVAKRFILSDEAAPGHVIPWATWLAKKKEGADLAGVGVAFPNDRDVRELTPYLAELPVVALVFPTWKDGRAYSQARKLTHLMGYRGVVLAVGDVLRDQVLYMSRVGFSAFHLREDQDPVATLRAFSLYSAFYQY